MLAVLVVVGIAVRAALPWAIARTLESQARSQLGLPVRLANVDLWLLRGAVALEGLVVGRKPEAATDAPVEPDPDTALLQLSRLFVRLDWGALLDRSVHLRELSLLAPRLRVERDAEGRIDPLGPPPPAEPAPEPAAAEASEAWTFAVDRFELRGLDLALADLATQRTPVEFALAGLSLTDITLAGSDLGLGGLEIDSPALRIDRDFVFGAAPGAESGGEGPPPTEGAGASDAFAYQIEHIGIADATFTLRTDAGPIEIGIRLDAERVNAREGERFPVDLALGIGEGKLWLRGQIGLNPLVVDGRLGWSDLALPPLGVAARPELADWVRSCRAEGDLAVELRTAPANGEAPGLRVSGATKVHDLLVADPSNDEVSVGWRELEVVVHDAFVPFASEGEAPRATRVSLEKVRLVEPDLLYTLPAPALDELLGRGGEPPAADPGPSESGPPPLELGVDSLDVEGGRLRFRDRTVSPPVDATLRDLSVAVRSAGLPQPHARSVRSTGILLETGSFSLEGGLEKDTGQLRFDLERLALAPFDPYAAKVGYEVTGGEASLDTKVRTRGERIDADSRLVLHRLDLSSRDPSAFEERFGMPLDVALALLRDPAGDISLAIPVVVDAGGARAGVATIVQGALRQALLGALASPLKLVGAALPKGGGGEASFAPLEAVPGLAQLAPGSDERLRALARLLADRPALGLRLRGRAGPADRPLVAEQMLVERAAAGGALPDVEGLGFLARRRIAQALAARGRGEDAPLSPEDRALLEAMVAGVDVPPTRLRELAQRRAEAARDALAVQHGIETRRLPIADPAAEGDPAVAIELATAAAAP